MSEGEITVSAPGKVILHGEHSVVYGRRAVAMSLNLRTTLTLTPGGTKLILDLPQMQIQDSWPLQDIEALWNKLKCPGNERASPLNDEQTQQVKAFLDLADESIRTPRALALRAFFQLYFAILPRPIACILKVNSDIPVGAGLGSSAAYGVCLAAALLKVAGRGQDGECSGGLDLDVVNSWAFRSEEVVHGTPSGIDNSICTYGGAVSFKNGKCAPLNAPSLQVLLVNTNVPRSTKALVAGVKARLNRLPEVIEPILTALDCLAEKGLATLTLLSTAITAEEQNEAYATLHEIVDINHALLSSLGVSHASLERVVNVAASHNLHAKLTGAGGGGFAVVVLSKNDSPQAVDKCKNDLENAGFQVWLTSLGASGLTFH